MKMKESSVKEYGLQGSVFRNRSGLGMHLL